MAREGRDGSRGEAGSRTLERATGRRREAWFALLDDVDAPGWDHATGEEASTVDEDAVHATARWRRERNEFLLATASASDVDAARVSITWGRLPDDARIAATKSELRRWLGSIDA